MFRPAKAILSRIAWVFTLLCLLATAGVAQDSIGSS